MTKIKAAEPISDVRLQTLIDILKRQYVRDRGDANTFDIYTALLELKTTRRLLYQASTTRTTGT